MSSIASNSWLALGIFAAADDLGLVQAWMRWCSGSSLAGDHLWGLQILWWGRIGNCLMFASGLTIVAELIGPSRLSIFAQRLRGVIQVKHVIRPTVDAWKEFVWSILLVLSMVIHFWGSISLEMKCDDLMEKIRPNGKGWELIPLVAFLLGTVAGIYVFINKPADRFDRNLFLVVLAFLGTFIFICIVVSFGLSILMSCIFFVVGALSWPISFIAWALNKRRAEFSVKVAALIAMVIGFHFNLLAS